jgi:hypothetical protein
LLRRQPLEAVHATQDQAERTLANIKRPAQSTIYTRAVLTPTTYL